METVTVRVASQGGHELQRPLGGADAIDSLWLKGFSSSSCRFLSSLLLFCGAAW